MENYILQTIAFQLAFLLVYELLLKKETFFTYNRIYLLVTPILALLLPLLHFQVLQNAVPAETFIMLPEVLLGTQVDPQGAAKTVTATAEGNKLEWLWIFYGIGAFISFLLFLKKYNVLKSLFRNPVISENEELRIIQVPDSDLACTFFKTVFLGDRLQEEEVEQIMSHEKVHVKQKHSLDLLFFELLKILFWFNPLIYIYQSRLSLLHEFIADAGVVKKVEKQTYYQQMLNTAFSTKDISFINQFFNHSIIKKRIVMLQKSRSKTIAKFKYLLLVPLMLVMLTFVACSEEQMNSYAEGELTAQEKIEQIKAIVNDGTEITAEDRDKIEALLSGLSIKEFDEIFKEVNIKKLKTQELKSSASGLEDIPFAVIEEVPVFPGCEDLATNKERKECLTQHVTEFVNKNFDTSIGKREGLTGINRTYVQFKINKEGEVEVMGVRAPNAALKKEAERVINLLPRMTPGKQNDREVGVLYSLPIIFQVGE